MSDIEIAEAVGRNVLNNENYQAEGYDAYHDAQLVAVGFFAQQQTITRLTDALEEIEKMNRPEFDFTDDRIHRQTVQLLAQKALR